MSTASTYQVQINPLTMTSTSQSHRTPDMMPLVGQKSAPTKFKGSHEHVKRFLRHYNQLCNAYNLSDADKCERIIDYCSTKVVKLIEALSSYRDQKWTELQQDISRYYDAALKETRYNIRDLITLARTWKLKPINSLTKWKKYERQYMTIAGWLLAKSKISDDQMATYFWHGINKKLRSIIELRLINSAGTTPLDVTTPFEMDKIIKVVEVLFERNRFDVNVADSDSEIPGRNEDSDSDTLSDDSSSDESEPERRYSRKKSSSKPSNKKSQHKKWDTDEDEPKKNSKKIVEKKEAKKESRVTDKKTIPPQDEVESLIRQMSKLSIDDQRYGLAYYKALKLDPDIVHCVKPPNLHSSLKPSSPSSNNPQPVSTNNPFNTPRDQMMCYGCGKKGHGMSSCTKITDLISTGTILRDTSGRIILKDGTFIRRLPGESFVQAIERLTAEKSKSHFFALNSDFSQSESEEEEAYMIPALDSEAEEQDEDIQIMPVERSLPKSKAARKDALQGVYPPSRNKGKENERPTVTFPPIPTHPVKPGPLRTQTRAQGKPFTPESNIPVRPPPDMNYRDPQQIPINVRRR